MIDPDDANLWRAIVEALEAGVVVRDHDGTIVFINPAAERLGSVPASEAVGGLLGGRIKQVLRDDGAPMTTAELPATRVLKTGATVRDEIYGFETHDEGVRWLSVSAAPLRTGDSEVPGGVVMTAVDVTERVIAEQALRTSEERFRSVATTMFAGLVVYSARRDDNGEIVDLICEFVNDSVLENRGIAPAVQLGRGMLELFPIAREMGLFDHYVAVVETGEATRLTVPWFESELVTGAFEIAISKLGDGCVLVFRDITEILEAEAALQAANEELRQFTAVAAHDMAEPLRVLSGFAELLNTRVGDQLDPESRRWLDHIVSGAHDLRQLLEDVLEYSRAGSVPLRSESVDLGEVLGITRTALEGFLANATITVEALPVVQGDPMQLRRVFQNLLTNAVKYARPDLPLRVIIDATPVGDMWQIRVTDNGLEVPIDASTRIFEAFHRAHAQSPIAGTGLGLATARAIVERLGGRIWVEAAPDGGSRFCFTVPGAPAAS